MDFCRVIALNVCMYGNESNDRIDFFNEILSYCKFILNNCKEEKFDIHFFYADSGDDQRTKLIFNKCYNDFIFKHYNPFHSSWVINEKEYKIYKDTLSKQNSKLITELRKKIM